MENFNELSLHPSIARSLTEMGFEKPSPIQAQALPVLLGDATDFLGLAATGTGKTAAFAIPLLQKIEPKNYAVQALILCPTRELAIQVAGQVDLIGKHLGIRSVPVYGGAPYGDQIRGLRRGAQVVVGTPGRVIDHIERGTLSLDQINLVVLDEADEMISMGFKDDIETVLSSIDSEKSNIWLFSATMSPEVRRVADAFLSEPKKVEVNRKEMLPEAIEQLYFVTQESNKPEVLCKLIDTATDFYGLIFCQTKALVTDLVRYLTERGYSVDCLHGDMDQNARERTMQAFRDRRVTMLICTDVASRGLDVKDVTHVINYSIPRELDSYVHRIGRTARSGKKGYALSLVTPAHRYLIGRIERLTKRRMFEEKIPTRKEVGQKKIAAFLEKWKSVERTERALELLSDDWKASLSEKTPEEVAARFLTLAFHDLFVDKAAAPAASAKVAEKTERNDVPRAKPVVFKAEAKPVSRPAEALDESAGEAEASYENEAEFEQTLDAFFAGEEQAATSDDSESEDTPRERLDHIVMPDLSKRRGPYRAHTVQGSEIREDSRRDSRDRPFRAQKPFGQKSRENKTFAKKPWEQKPYQNRFENSARPVRSSESFERSYDKGSDRGAERRDDRAPGSASRYGRPSAGGQGGGFFGGKGGGLFVRKREKGSVGSRRY